MKVLDKYLFKEMVFPFLYGFLIILILVWGNIVYSYLNLIVSRISEWYLVLNFLICKLPSCVLISLAAGGIFGVSIGLNRIIKDSEMVALRSAGITSGRIFLSLMIFGIFITLVGYLFQEIIVVRAEDKSFNILQTLYSIPGDIPIEPDVFVKTDQYSIYINSIERNTKEVIYHQVQLYRLNSGYPTIINAKEAIENNGYWFLKDGFCTSFNKDGSPNTVTTFKTLKLEISSDIFSLITAPIEEEKALSSKQLYEEIKTRSKAGQNTRDLELEYYFKLAFPLSTLFILFCLIPLCLMIPMKNGAVGMVLGIIIFFIYWNIMWFSRILGETGGLPPAPAGFSIVIIFGIAGVILSGIIYK
ncbi:MAG: LptF/LptG family permease [Abditibacteriota bacterium]|nr:LptF/LptG family permease [Abditibacteriota bacterium]